MKNKKEKIMFLIIIVLTIAIVGISYAWITVTISGEKEYIVRAGTLDLVLDESSNGLLLEDEVPVEDKVGLASEGATFSVRNNGKSDACYKIYMDDLELEEGQTRVEDRFIKYSLEKNGKLGAATKLSSSGSVPERIIDEEEVRGGDTVSYTLRLWFSADENGDFGGQIFKGKLRIEAVQCILPEAPLMRSYTTLFNSNGVMMEQVDFHSDAYRTKITSVVTKTDLLVPETALSVTNGKGNYWDISAAGNKSVIAYIEDDGSGNGTYKLTLGGYKEVIANADSRNLFRNFTNVASIDLSHLNTFNVTNMSGMFQECQKLTDLNISNFITTNVTNMNSLFSRCLVLVTLDIQSFDTSKVQNMYGLFAFCYALKNIFVSNKWDLTNVTTQTYMYEQCSARPVIP